MCACVRVCVCVCVSQVFPDKRSLKLLKSQSINVNWYQYCPETAVILLSTTVQGNILQPFAFRVSVCLFVCLFVCVSNARFSTDNISFTRPLRTGPCPRCPSLRSSCRSSPNPPNSPCLRETSPWLPCKSQPVRIGPHRGWENVSPGLCLQLRSAVRDVPEAPLQDGQQSQC